MTISSTTRIAGPYTGSGTTGPFTFAFKVFQASDLVVVKREISTATDTVLTLTTDYSVTLNGNQNSSPGGSITLVSSISSSYELTLTSDIENKQPTDLTNQGGFYPEVITDALDRACIQIQQLASLNTRSLVAPISDGLSTSLALPAADLRANKYLAFDANGVPMAADGTDTPNITSAGNMTITANNAGSNVARDVIFYDNTTETMRVLGSGATSKVGIGTSNPSTKLHVKGATNILRLETTSAVGSGGACYLELYDSAGRGGYFGFGGSSNTLDIWNDLAGVTRFGTNNTERMRIDSSGKVGIGTSSPSAVLDLGAQGLGRGITWTASGTTEANNNIFSSYGGVGLVFAAGVAPSTSADSYLSPNSASIGRSMIRMDAFGSNAGTMQFYTNAASTITAGNAVTPTERMRIDSAGLVGIGTNSPGSTLDVSGGQIRVRSTGLYSEPSANTGVLYYNATNGDFTIDSRSAGGSTALVFRTSSTGTGTEKVRIDSSGNVGIGNSSPGRVLSCYRAGGASIQLANSTTGSGSDNGAILTMSTNVFTIAAMDATTIMQFATQNITRMTIDASGNTGFGITPAAFFHVNGTIRYTNRPAAGTITAMGWDANGDLKASSSSLRYKHDVQNYQRGLADIAALRPVTFKFNGEDRQNAGFIAEEIDALGMNELMLYDDQGRPDGVLYANMVAMLTKGIQELKAVVDAQAARIAALEANA